jgi:hypothetical protein
MTADQALWVSGVMGTSKEIISLATLAAVGNLVTKLNDWSDWNLNGAGQIATATTMGTR